VRCVHTLFHESRLRLSQDVRGRFHLDGFDPRLLMMMIRRRASRIQQQDDDDEEQGDGDGDGIVVERRNVNSHLQENIV